MNTHVLVFVGLILLSLGSGCSSVPDASRREPYVKPGLIMLTADQADRRGLTIKTADQAVEGPAELAPVDSSAVVAPSQIKVYTLGRTVDPADPNLLHEQHVIYRRETGPSWRLQASAEQKILVGPRITDGNESLQPLLNKELAAFLGDQRRATEANQKAIAALFDAVSSLGRQQEALLRRDAATVADKKVAAAADAERQERGAAEQAAPASLDTKHGD